jgi:hypothetical protein
MYGQIEAKQDRFHNVQRLQSLSTELFRQQKLHRADADIRQSL